MTIDSEVVVEKKKRGRPSKAEVAERQAAAVAAEAAAAEPIDPAPPAVDPAEDVVVEEADATYGEALDTWRPDPSKPLGRATLKREVLLEQLAVLARASARSQIPILSETVRLEVRKGALQMVVGDLELWVEVLADATYTKPSPGAAVVLLPLLRAAVALSAGESIQISPAPGRPEVLQVGDHEIRLAGSAIHFPAVPEPASASLVYSHVSAVTRALDKVGKFHAEKDEGRPVLMAVQIHAEARGVRFAGADHNRLASYWLPDVLPVGDASFDLLVNQPGRVANVLRTIPEGAAPLAICATDEVCQVVVEGAGETYRVTVRQFAGSYPDVAKLIPASGKLGFRADRASLLEVLKILQPVTGESSLVQLEFPETEKAKASFQPVRLVTAALEHSVVLLVEPGPAWSVAFNAKYLVEALASGEGDTVMVAIAGPEKAARLTYPAIVDYDQVVMPVKPAQ